jgi:predicted phosphoribosyltransferase
MSNLIEEISLRDKLYIFKDRKEADEIVCLNVRTGFLFAVADAYKIWDDLADEEVLDILRDNN